MMDTITLSILVAFTATFTTGMVYAVVVLGD